MAHRSINGATERRMGNCFAFLAFQQLVLMSSKSGMVTL